MSYGESLRLLFIVLCPQGFPCGSAVKTACQRRTQETQFPSLGREDLLEEEMAIHSSILAFSHGQRNLAGCSHRVTKSGTRLSD